MHYIEHSRAGMGGKICEPTVNPLNKQVVPVLNRFRGAVWRGLFSLVDFVIKDDTASALRYKKR